MPHKQILAAGDSIESATMFPNARHQQIQQPTMNAAAENTSVTHRLSVVIPMYNEQDNVAPMIARVHEALAAYPHPWELVLVDDGSTDGTVQALHDKAKHYGGHVRVVELQRNFGQTAAMQAGIDVARGDVIATLDGDLQNDPADIARMVKRLLEENLDLVAGWRQNRQDNWLRKIPSRIANRLIRRITHVNLHDYGCSLKIFRADIIKHVRLYGEMHRFIPAWTATHTTPARIKEEVVRHHARKYGTSKYGIGRTFRVILDLLAVYFFMRYRSKPGHFFGKIGIVFGALGGLGLAYLAFVKLILGEDIGGRPLLLISVLFVMLAVQMITTGVLSELISRTYYESGDIKSYVVRNARELSSAGATDWKRPE
jgi:glycosyltransferase involved in cell wall biosynthesis